MGKIALIIMGQSPQGVSSNGSGIEFHQGKSYFSDWLLEKSPFRTDRPSKIVSKNTILMSVRAPVGDVCYTNRVICIGRGLAGIQYLGSNDQRYFFYLLKGLKQTFMLQSTGTTFKEISKDVLVNAMVSLPPQQEQARIVNRLERIWLSLDV